MVARTVLRNDFRIIGDLYVDGEIIGAVLGGPFASRVEAQAASVPAQVAAISVIHSGKKLDYVYDATGTALATADGRTWSPAGVSTPFHWGAVDDYDSDLETGTNSTAAYLAMRDWVEASLRTEIEISGETFVNQPIVFNAFYVNMRPHGEARIWGGHTSGPILQFRKSYFNVERIRVEATSARRAAAFNILNAGIITGDFDWEDPDEGEGTSGAFGRIVQCSSQYHPGDGILAIGAGGTIEQNNCLYNKGMGIRADAGAAIGVAAAADLGYPGWSTIAHNRCSFNEMQGIAVGSPNDSGGNVMYRYEVDNNDVGHNECGSGSYSLHQVYLVGEQINSKLNGIAGGDAGPGMYVAGTQQEHQGNRFLSLNGEAYEIGDLVAYPTLDLTIDSFRVSGPLASLNPAVKIASTLTAADGVKVRQGSATNITKLVADADRAKYAEISYRESFNFSQLYENDIRVGPLTEGTFTPTITFVTPGDLGVSYSTQTGSYKRLGANLAFIQLELSYTPTHTTASGTFLINLPSLPFNLDDDAGDRGGLTIGGLTRINYDTGQLQAFVRVNSASTLRMVFSQDAGVEVAAAVVNFPTGTAQTIILSGLVRTD